MIDEITIVEATIDDVQDLVQLNILFNGSSDSATAMAERMTEPRRVETIIIARVNGKIAGFAALRIVPCVLYPTPHAELTELYVKEDYRQLGIGKRLVQYLEELALKKCADDLLVLTGADNLPALSLYHALGFEDYDISLQKSLHSK
jgi:ribosomal protein S18 acetylase RimI-like enzyme